MGRRNGHRLDGPRNQTENEAAGRAGGLSSVTWVDGNAALLDLDGTLVDSEPLHRLAFREYFSRRGWPLDEHTLSMFMGRRGADVLASTDGPWRDEDPHAVTDAIIETFAGMKLTPTPVPGASEFLRGLVEADVPIAIVTSARRDWALTALAALGADVQVLVTAEQCPDGKPHPGPYLQGAAALGIEPWQAFALEDSLAGVQSAKAAGVGAIVGVSTSLPGAALVDAGADVTVADLARLRARPTHAREEAIHGSDVPRCR